MGFKTKVLPSLEVLRADGQVCRGFAAKTSALHSAQPLPTGKTAAKPSAHYWEA